MSTPDNPHLYDGNCTFFLGSVTQSAEYYAQSAAANFPDLQYCHLSFEDDASHLHNDFNALRFNIDVVNVLKYKGEAFLDALIPQQLGHDDFESLLSCQAESFEFDTQNFLPNRLLAELESEHMTYFGLREGGHIVASLLFIQTSFGAVIENFCVRTELRGRGIGTSLIKSVLKFAQGQDVYIGAEKNSAPDQLYQKLGFKSFFEQVSFLRI